MKLVLDALGRPITVVVALIAIALSSVLALQRMPVDIFPHVGDPAIYVAQPHGGMDPVLVEGFIAYYYEYHYLYITGIDHVESKSIQGATLMKLVFHQGTNMAQAMPQTVGYVNRARLYADRHGAAFHHPLRRRQRGGGPAGFQQRKPYTAGQMWTGKIARIARTNATLGGNLGELLGTPIRPVSGTTVYLRDIDAIENGTDLVTAYAHVNGRRTVYIPVTKRADASTLSVINTVRASLPDFKKIVPEDIDVRLEFDQSPHVTNSLRGLVIEGLLGAALTGLMSSPSSATGAAR